MIATAWNVLWCRWLLGEDVVTKVEGMRWRDLWGRPIIAKIPTPHRHPWSRYAAYHIPHHPTPKTDKMTWQLPKQTVPTTLTIKPANFSPQCEVSPNSISAIKSSSVPVPRPHSYTNTNGLSNRGSPRSRSSPSRSSHRSRCRRSLRFRPSPDTRSQIRGHPKAIPLATSTIHSSWCHECRVVTRTFPDSGGV